MTRPPLTLTVNGPPVQLPNDPRVSLLDFLPEDPVGWNEEGLQPSYVTADLSAHAIPLTRDELRERTCSNGSERSRLHRGRPRVQRRARGCREGLVGLN